VAHAPAVGVLTLEIHIEAAHSLKDKRNVVKSLKDRLRRRYNVAVAEIGDQEVMTRALVAAVTVSPSRDYGAGVLESVEREAASELGGALVGATVEWLA
jgi:uncharacterized protein YlxP (DUF503 family)